MRKILSCLMMLVFCLLFLTSCVVWQKLFTQYETFEVKLGKLSVDVKMPQEIPLKLIKVEDSKPFFIVGDFVGIRFAFDEAHIYDYVDFALKNEGDKLTIYGVVSWSPSGVPAPKCWFYVDGFPFPSTLREIKKFLLGK